MIKNMKKGFTLVEMMIVVAIIAVLAGVAVPQYGKYIKKSETVEGVAFMRQIIDAEILYNTTQNEYLAITLDAAGIANLETKLYITIPAGAKFVNYKVDLCPTKNGFMVTASTSTATDNAIYNVYPKRTTEITTIEDYVNSVTTTTAPACN